jgi:hypothetical protein
MNVYYIYCTPDHGIEKLVAVVHTPEDRDKKVAFWSKKGSVRVWEWMQLGLPDM